MHCDPNVLPSPLSLFIEMCLCPTFNSLHGEVNAIADESTGDTNDTDWSFAIGSKPLNSCLLIGPFELRMTC